VVWGGNSAATDSLSKYRQARTRPITSKKFSFNRPSSSRVATSHIARPTSISVEPMLHTFRPIATRDKPAP
jgi:hypothetical protein